MIYDNLIKNTDNIQATLTVNYIQGPKVEILSPVKAEYLVEFINNKTGKVLHSSVISNNCWTKCSFEYCIDWLIKTYQKIDGNFELIDESTFDATDKRVYIALDSKALGDTLAWFPYVEEFKKKHNCKIICSTFHNELLTPQYPDLEFIKPGETAYNLYAMFTLGWHYKENQEVNRYRTPNDFKLQNLQKTASDILGLDFEEVKPRLAKYEIEKKKQVSIAIHGTTQAKYWNNLKGWQEVVDWCRENGYEVLLLSKEGDTYMGNNHPKGIKQLPAGPLENVIRELQASEAFIGIGSGLTWLSWATGIPTVLISGFSEEYTEPSSCYRIGAPEGKCSGCFNKFQLDAGDWNWCPVHKGTERQFECTKAITGQSIIEVLKGILN
jgi:autotransporter strand-loop-strand O-heptosyltransferase